MDNTISLTELLRAVQLFNASAYHCDEGSEDDYATGTGDQTCLPHDLDYNPQDWAINLSELLRLVQIYSTGGYSDCVAGEDGFCPVTQIVEGESEGFSEGVEEGEQTVTFTIDNQTTCDITELYIRVSGTTDWGTNWIPTGFYIGAGAYSIPGFSVGYYDFAVGCSAGYAWAFEVLLPATLDFYTYASQSPAQYIGYYIYAQDNQYLGKITPNQFDLDSIVNSFGLYGSFTSPTSISNSISSIYGSAFSQYSAFNSYAQNPPIIYSYDGVNFISRAYLTTNQFKNPRLDTNVLFDALLSKDDGYSLMLSTDKACP